MEEYGIMEYLELTVTRCGWWMGNRKFIWSGLRKRLLNKPLLSTYWNSLPYEIATSPNVLSFKTNLDHFLYNKNVFYLYDLIEIGFIRLRLLLTNYT